MWDVLIIGAGPAGSAAAVHLARAGLKILCLDRARFPRQKVCGEFISPEARPALEALGLGPRLRAVGAVPIQGLRLAGPRGRTLESSFEALRETPSGVAREGEYREKEGSFPDGIGVSRWTLDALLVRAARSFGAEVEDEFNVTGLRGGPGRWTLMGRSRGQTRPIGLLAPHVLAADGHHSSIARLLGRRERGPGGFGFKAHFEGMGEMDDRVQLDFVRGGYVGTSRIEGGLANVCLLLQGRGRGLAPDKDLDTFLLRLSRENASLARRMAGGHRVGKWLSVGGLHFCVRGCSLKGVAFLGDAAAAMDPFLGDGVAMALRSAELATKALIEGLGRGDPHLALSELYPRSWAFEFNGRHRWAARLRAFRQIPDAVIGFLSRRGRFLQYLLQATRSPAPPPQGVLRFLGLLMADR